MRTVSQIKGSGYMISILSVFLVAVPAWKGASEEPLLLACLVMGMVLSIAGMGLRWRSHRLEQREKDRNEKERRRAPDPVNYGGARIGASR